MSFNKYISSSQQSVIDICLVCYGTLDYIIKLCNDNNLTMQSYIPNGTNIFYDSTYVPNSTRFTTANFLYGSP